MCRCLYHKMSLKTRVGNSNNTPQEPEAERDRSRRSRLSAAPKSTEDLRPHILVTSAHLSQQEREEGLRWSAHDQRVRNPENKRQQAADLGRG